LFKLDVIPPSSVNHIPMAQCPSPLPVHVHLRYLQGAIFFCHPTFWTDVWLPGRGEGGREGTTNANAFWAHSPSNICALHIGHWHLPPAGCFCFPIPAVRLLTFQRAIPTNFHKFPKFQSSPTILEKITVNLQRTNFHFASELLKKKSRSHAVQK
jgi:hypothetical protein